MQTDSTLQLDIVTAIHALSELFTHITTNTNAQSQIALIAVSDQLANIKKHLIAKNENTNKHEKAVLQISQKHINAKTENPNILVLLSLSISDFLVSDNDAEKQAHLKQIIRINHLIEQNK